MNKRKTIINIFIIMIISLSIMYITDSIINPGYIYKSVIKLLLFMAIPVLYTMVDRNIKLKEIFKLRSKKQLLISIILGLGVYIIIFTAYLILKGFIDLENIKNIMEKSINVNRDNFIQVAIYISFINSLLEEFFFRGFIFLNFKKLFKRELAYIASALAFAIYHVAIMANWFTVPLFILSMIGLFVGGLIFNYLNDKNSNIYSSWLVHMAANFAINTVGFIMFEII